jgi:hypothetical protein
MYEMISWLAFPTELGRYPDDIRIVDRRPIAWPESSQPVECVLYRFRDGDRWLHGITGPITFSFFEEFTGKTPDEIYAAYLNWYIGEGIGNMIEEELRGGDGGGE